jgi:hypothetical protein
MATSGMLSRVALVRTDVSEETPFSIVTAVKTSNPKYNFVWETYELNGKPEGRGFETR